MEPVNETISESISLARSSLKEQFAKLKKKRRDHKYEPINTAEREIRVLDLLPSSQSTTLSCHIRTVRLSDDDSPQYEGLSYVWGFTETLIDVEVYDGPKHVGKIPVTENLAEALQYLRFIDTPRTLWTDAICINQEDLSERSKQVKLMGEIFSRAQRIIAWLGPETIDTRSAFSILEHVASTVEVDWRTNDVSHVLSRDHDFWWYNTQKPFTLETSTFNGIIVICYRPWFSQL